MVKAEKQMRKTDDTDSSRDIAIADMAEFLSVSKKLVVLTGAGASTESGIPDFRSPGGVWARQVPTPYRDFMSDETARRGYWHLRRELYPLVMSAKPNATHAALVTLEKRGILLGIITQNFDGLHQGAGSDPAHVVELHGTSREAECQQCGARQPIATVQARVDAGDDDPRCDCGGYLKAATILFGQRVPQAALDIAFTWTNDCDCFLVIGSSLRVSPAARLPRLAAERGIALLIVNREPTPLDEFAEVVIHAESGLTLTRLIERLST